MWIFVGLWDWSQNCVLCGAGILNIHKSPRQKNVVILALAVVLHESLWEGIILTAWRLRAEEDIVTACSGWLCSRGFFLLYGRLRFHQSGEFNFSISLRWDFYRNVTLCTLQNLQESRADLYWDRSPTHLWKQVHKFRVAGCKSEVTVMEIDVVSRS